MRSYRVRIFKSKDGWRWHLMAPNNRIVACSGEAFSSPSAAKKSYKKVECEITLCWPSILVIHD